MLTQEVSLNTNNLKNYQQWKQANGNDFSLWDYIFGVGNVEIALAFSKLFWPDFIEYDRGIFLAETFNPQICEEWKAKLENDINAVEKVMNHIHLEDILPEAEKVEIENIFYLGQVLSQMWESRLKLLYPNQCFQVECNRDDSTVIVTFYRKVK